MQNRIDRHTRLVAWAKVALPIVALSILSTLFLLSRSVDPIASIPFSESDLAERTESQQISEPQVYSVSPRGDLISLRAARANQPADQSGIMTIKEVRAQIKLISGQTVDLSAGMAELNNDAQIAVLSGQVSGSTSTGYSFKTERLRFSLNDLALSTDTPVRGEGPFGTVTADTMQLSAREGEKNAQILLKGDVKMVYTPQEVRD